MVPTVSIYRFIYVLVRDIFTSIRGDITTLIQDSRFVDNLPTTSEVVQSAFSFNDFGDYYGQRIRALYIAPATGAYTFAISGNNYVKLYLSTDSSAVNKNMIAEAKSWTGFGEYTKFPEQTSQQIQLVAGGRYCK